MTTDTPRTDAVQFQPRPISMTIENEMLRALSRQLERELSALQRLRPTRDDVQKLEVERLRGSLRDQERSLGTSQFYLARAIEIAEIVGWTQNVAYLSELRAELNQLKATLNPNKK